MELSDAVNGTTFAAMLTVCPEPTVHEFFFTLDFGTFLRCLDLQTFTRCGQCFGFVDIGQQSVVAYATESRRQEVQGEATQELDTRQLHHFCGTLLAIVLVAKMDVMLVDINNAMIADSDLVGITPEVFNHTHRRLISGLGVNDLGFCEAFALLS